VRNSCASASTKAAAERWLTATPLGNPVEPDVKMIQASSAGVGSCGPASNLDRLLTVGRKPSGVITPMTAASPNTRSARSCGSSASTGT